MDMARHSKYAPEVRPLSPKDVRKVRLLYDSLDLHDSYMRWFGPKPKELATLADHLCKSSDQECALGAFINDELVGIGNYTVLEGVSPITAELALVVARDERLHGVGTLLLDRLENEATHQGVRRLAAEIMVSNGPMLQVVRERGWAHSIRREGPTLHLDVAI